MDERQGRPEVQSIHGHIQRDQPVAAQLAEQGRPHALVALAGIQVLLQQQGTQRLQLDGIDIRWSGCAGCRPFFPCQPALRGGQRGFQVLFDHREQRIDPRAVVVVDGPFDLQCRGGETPGAEIAQGTAQGMKRPGRIAMPTFPPGALRFDDRVEPAGNDLPDQDDEGVEVVLVILVDAEQGADIEDRQVVAGCRRGHLRPGNRSGDGGRHVLADGGQHLVGIYGFGDEAIHSRRQALLAFVAQYARGNGQHRQLQLQLAADGPGGGNTIQHRHVHVHEHQLETRRVGAQPVDGLLAILADFHRRAGMFQYALGDELVQGVVLHQQQMHALQWFA
ncbi:hypothetical protein FQZ97_441290 [compost metagenome]